MESETELHELSAEFIFLCPSFQHDGPLVSSLELRFLPVLLLLWELLLSWAPAVLGLHLPGARRGSFSQGKSESWHHRYQVSVCSSVLSHHNKDLK